MSATAESSTQIKVGDPLPEWGVAAIDAAKMKVLALLLADPNPIHFDREAAHKTGAPNLVNQGPSNMAMLVNAVRQAFPDGHLTKLRMRLTGRVLAGQPVDVAGEVTAVDSTPERTVLTCEVRLRSASAIVLVGEAEIVLTDDNEGCRTW